MSGVFAELLSDSPTNTPTSILTTAPIGYDASDLPTLGKMQAGSLTYKNILLIEGCKYVLTDCADASAVQSALVDTDWASAEIIPGLFVELQNSHEISLLDPFASGGRLVARVLDTNDDTFGEFINKRLSGAETAITATVDRDDTTINVASTTGFTSSGEIYIGNECIGYTGTTATSFTGCTRGKYSPMGCADSGTGGDRFAGHHRKAKDPNHVQLNPLVSQLPRTWLGKRAALYIHTWTGGELNSLVNAQRVFAGRLVGIADDPQDFTTVLEFDHIAKDIENGVVGKDLYRAEVAPGIDLVTGREFVLGDWKDGSSALFTDALVVVASGASTAWEVNAGRYTGEELCSILNSWLAASLAAADIYGYYNWVFGVTTNTGVRTRCYWRIEAGSNVSCGWGLTMPGEIAAFLGIKDAEGDPRGQSVTIYPKGRTSDQDLIYESDGCPYHSIVFRPHGPSHSQEFSEAITYTLHDERGSFIDQQTYLPSVVKSATDTSHQWGLYMLEDRTLIVAAYTTTDGEGTLQKTWIAPFQLVNDKDTDAMPFFGRRLDDPNGGPITIRQVLILESKFGDLFNALVYSTGVSGYNSTHDTFAYGLGLGIPGVLLGEDWDRSVTSLPQSNAPITVVIDEPTSFGGLFAADLQIRRAFVRWKNEGFSVAQWATPTEEMSVASFTESNKAAPSGQEDNHRIASQEVVDKQRPIVKVDFARDFTTGKDGIYQKSVTLEDQTVVDDMGGSARSYTIKLRNQYNGMAGADMQTLLSQFLAFMPILSRAFRVVVRSIDLRFFEGIGVGDVVSVTDNYARDPVTGRRGIDERPAVITRLVYDMGGPNPNGTVRGMSGECEMMFLDASRHGHYAPSAELDNTANFGGFDAGYNSSTKTIRCIRNRYSHVITIKVRNGYTITIPDTPDAQRFEDGDEVLVYEIDPDDPSSVTSWTDTVDGAPSGNDITLTTGLTSFDTSKRYRITYQSYTDCTGEQQNACFQSDGTDGMIQDTDPGYQFAATNERYGYNAPPTDRSARFVADLTRGDGKAHDAGTDQDLCVLIDAAIDRKTAHQLPFLDDASISSSTGFFWTAGAGGLIHFGFEQLGGTVTRKLTVAPRFRSSTGGVQGKVRVTLSRVMPMVPPSTADESGTPLAGSQFGSHYSQSAEWSTTSDTWQIGADAELEINVKDIHFGLAWLTIETWGFAQCTGLSKCIEGPREVG